MDLRKENENSLSFETVKRVLVNTFSILFCICSSLLFKIICLITGKSKWGGVSLRLQCVLGSIFIFLIFLCGSPCCQQHVTVGCNSAPSLHLYLQTNLGQNWAEAEVCCCLHCMQLWEHWHVFVCASKHHPRRCLGPESISLPSCSSASGPKNRS